MLPYLTPLFFLLLSAVNTCAQINAYAKVNSITTNTLSLLNVTESFDSFEDGEQILIYQVQDNTISNTSNTTNFGDLNSIQSAGLFELATILSHTETAGIPTTITITAPLSNSYNIGANSSLQIISFPELGSPNFTTTSNITGVAWDGNIGGVVAFQVTNKLTLNHDINANSIGFRGGSVSANATGSANCTTGNAVYISNSTLYGEKGEGIYKYTNNNFRYSRGKLLNGGGGGSHHNGGGGGGGNRTLGGEGGSGYSGTAAGCPSTSSCGGLGGIELSPYINNNRLFLGGGGGGGEQNNNVGSSGTNGGGFIFIKADSLTITNCSLTHSISANGGHALNGQNDGMGGAGAGGSIKLDISVYDLTAACLLSISANGGDGGDANTGTAHAGGGGGGIGTIQLSSTPPSSVTTNTNPGNGGCNNSACNSTAGSGLSTPLLLPITLLDFDIKHTSDNDWATLFWTTTFEHDNDHFVIQKSKDGINWVQLDIVSSLGNSTQAQFYQYTDYNLLPGHSYYRLKQANLDGTYSYSSIRNIYVEELNTKGVFLFPNPATSSIELKSKFAPITEIKVYTLLGQAISVPTTFSNHGHIAQMQLKNLEPGIYLLHTNVGLFKLQKI